MKKIAIAIAILATAISAHAQLIDNVDIPQAPIVEKIVGNRGVIPFSYNEQSWNVDIDGVNSNGVVSSLGGHSVTMLDAVDALTTLDPSIDWAEKIPLIYQVVFQLASANGDSANITQQMTTPVIMPRGIEVPVVVLQSETNDYGIGLIAADDGTVLTYIDHQSPRPSQEEIDARIAAKLADHKAKKDAGVAGVNGQLQKRIENIESYLGWR